jgi:ferredoxin
MPTVKAQGKNISCDVGANLRRVLLNHGVDLYNGNAKIFNCRGAGTCGTCAVKVEGDVSEPAWREKLRLSLPPHSGKNSRLACQARVLGDVKVIKNDGFSGEKDYPVWTSEQASISSNRERVGSKL